MSDSTSARPGEGDSPGALLRAAREKQGLHIAALAASIKVSPRKLDALENDRWHELPDATFSRALALTVCRTLKIDPRPVLERLPAADPGSLEQVGGSLNTPFQDRQARAIPGVSAGAIRPMVWAGALLAVAAVVVYFLPPQWLGGDGGDGAAAPSGGAGDTVLPPLSWPASAPASAGLAASAVPPAGDAASDAAPPGSQAASAGPAGETVFAAPSPAEAVVAAGAGSAPLTTPPAGLVQLRASDSSWVEARDAAGQLLLSRTVQPGESVGLNGELPLRLVIGNASATELGFRGRPVDLTPLTRDNIARVELR